LRSKEGKVRLSGIGHWHAARLATVERELSRLDVRHELAMSAFKFDEARDLQRQIALFERERGELIDALPPPTEPPVAVPPR
jgi:hypothetical protein